MANRKTDFGVLTAIQEESKHGVGSLPQKSSDELAAIPVSESAPQRSLLLHRVSAAGSSLYAHELRGSGRETGVEKTFFAELCMFNDVDDGNSGFVATACEIVDGNSAGGRRINHLFKDGKFPPDYYDGENCYTCAERIKHPPGAVCRAGHDVLGYGFNEEESLVE